MDTISSGPKPANNSKSHTFGLTCVVALLKAILVEYGKGDNWAVGLDLPQSPGKPPIPHGNFARWNILEYAPLFFLSETITY